jgi:hypothetical protein
LPSEVALEGGRIGDAKTVQCRSRTCQVIVQHQVIFDFDAPAAMRRIENADDVGTLIGDIPDVLV